jgi:phage tail-like protein
LRRTTAGFELVDVGSTNGTQVGGYLLEVGVPRLMQEGDVISIGHWRLTFRLRARVAPVPPHRPAPPLRDFIWPVGSSSRYLKYLPTIFQLQDYPDESDDDTLDGVNGQHHLNGAELWDGFDRQNGFDPTNGLTRYSGFSLSGSARATSLTARPDPNAFLGRFLRIFEAIWEPLEQRQDYLQLYFDPRTCPPIFLDWLASWLNISLPPRLPLRRKRRFLSEAMDLYRLRGTREGLSRVITACTDLIPVIEDDPELPFVVRIGLAMPQDHDVDAELIEELIVEHKPAYLGYVLDIHRASGSEPAHA